MSAQNKSLHMIAWILLVVGGLNWLLVGIVNWGVGDLFVGSAVWVAKLIYILVGLSAVYELATHNSRCKDCETNAASKPMNGGFGSPMNP